MRWGPAWAISLKVFRTLRRDRRSLALILVGPILAILAFGFVFGTDITNIRLVVVNHDDGLYGRAFVDALDTDLLDIRFVTSDVRALHAVEQGDAWAAIVIPENLSAQVEAGLGGETRRPLPAQLDLILDGSNAQIVLAITDAVQAAMRTSIPGSAEPGPIGFSQTIVYAEGAQYIDFFVPGIISFAAFMFTALLTSVAFVTERTSGMLSRLQTSPILDSEIVLGHAMAFGVVAAVQATILFSAAVLAFDLLVEGSVLLAVSLVVLLGITSQALGILLSAISKREAQAVQLFPIIVIPTLVLSGIFLPIESLPIGLRPFSYIVPPTWSTHGLRAVLLRGWGLDKVWMDLVALAGFAVLFLLLAVQVLKRQRR